MPSGKGKVEPDAAKEDASITGWDVITVGVVEDGGDLAEANLEPNMEDNAEAGVFTIEAFV
jgi:hypothetical protein